MVSAAEMLSIAAFLEGRYAHPFPSFGSERMGAPVMAFCRISDQPIRLREPVSQPDALIIQDPTLLHHPNLFEGLQIPDGFVLINSSRSLDELGIISYFRKLPPDHVMTVPATELALRHVGRPLPRRFSLARRSEPRAWSALRRRASGPLSPAIGNCSKNPGDSTARAGNSALRTDAASAARRKQKPDCRCGSRIPNN